MQFLNNIQQLEKSLMNQTRFDRHGNATTDKKYCAEMIIVANNENKINYFIQTYGGTIYDPHGPYGKRESVLDLKLKKVSQKIFNNYIEYLKTKNLKYLTTAQRGLIDDRS